MSAVDLFAGPGGWDVAARNLDVEVLGIELDESACETRLANKLLTLPGDVRQEDPLLWEAGGLIASPPCQTFSTAGKGAGRDALDVVLLEGESLWRGATDRISYEYFKDERTGLVLEPLRWAMERINAGSPFKWIALEQVPSVLPVWEMFARLLREAGYSVVTSVVSAEEYGVPQTRRRAVLLAHLTRDVKLPPATHRKYKKGVPQDAGDPDLKPWVSMADALGWSGLVGFPRLDDGREAVEINGTAYRARDLRDASLPAQVVTGKTRSWARFPDAMGDVRQSHGTVRSVNEPAPTMTASMDNGNFQWVCRGGTGANATVRDLTEPAPTVHFGARLNKWEWRLINQSGVEHDMNWPAERPATTITSAPVVHMPGQNASRHNTSSKSRNDGIRVTAPEAACLQSFPADFRWEGTKTKQFQQIGNAIPPLLAEALLREVL